MTYNSDLYFQDIFYKIDHLSVDQKKQLLIDAKNVSYNVRIDRHDSHGVRKQQNDITFDEIIELLDQKSHFVFIHRKGYESWKNPDILYNDTSWCLETGFCQMGTGRDYFLFINTEEDKIQPLVKKYNLTHL